MEDEIVKFLLYAKAQCKSQEIRIMMGDQNTKVRKKRDGDIVGKLGRETHKVRGEKWT